MKKEQIYWAMERLAIGFVFVALLPSMIALSLISLCVNSALRFLDSKR